MDHAQRLTGGHRLVITTFLVLGGLAFLGIGGAAATNTAWVAPAHAQQAAAAIVSGYDNEFRLTTEANQWKQVGQLNLPAGSYTISAKLYTDVPLPDGLNVSVACQLTAGSDFDRTRVSHDGRLPYASLALNVVHTFASPGSVILKCRHDFTAGDTYLRFIKLTAISGTSLQNGALLP